MKRTVAMMVAILALGWIALGLVACRKGGTDRTGPLRPAPDFSLTDLSGQPLRLSDYRGKVVILDFWATWCDPCREEIPHFIELQNKYSQQVQFIGISIDDDDKPVRAFRQQYIMNYPVALGTPKLADQYGGILGLPITFVIDRQGRIVSRHIGATNPSVLEQEIQKLL